MGLKIVCSGHLIRYPLGGHSWHHLQYLVGFQRLGHEVTFLEDYGWSDSCYDPSRGVMTADPDYGIEYCLKLFRQHGLKDRWCYLAENGTAYGMPREEFAQRCREADLYLNLSNINWVPEFEECQRRVLVDTDPVLTQIGAHGLGGPLSRYHVLFTYGENVHRPGCDMPTAGAQWLATRQPVVLDLWPVTEGDPSSPLTTVMKWSSIGDRVHEGRVYGEKSREFQPYFALPREVGEPMEMAVSAPASIRQQLTTGGWRVIDPGVVTRDPWVYQEYLKASRAEFCVARHAYVSTHCGWFSDRSTAYLALGRPVVVQDTGFSAFLPCGEGVLAFRAPAEARAAIRRLGHDYPAHCRAARAVVEECFDARRVLSDLLEKSL